ncbi:MAG: hypothetical protein M1503_00215 [Thaumarchaeota archaeon]|nr:hypothetical protein [Nitrososphaerota archaeon]MCL5316675.1 hypothetical protein [Nitrososphaerota archaeon]
MVEKTARSLNQYNIKFRSSFPSFILNLLMTFLVWLYGLAVFIPMTSLIQSTQSLTPIISFTFLAAMIYFLAKALVDGKRAVDSYVQIASSRSRSRLTLVKNGGYGGLVLLAGIAVIPLSWWIHPVFGGITLVGIVIIGMFFAIPLMQRAVERLAARPYQST